MSGASVAASPLHCQVALSGASSRPQKPVHHPLPYAPLFLCHRSPNGTSQPSLLSQSGLFKSMVLKKTKQNTNPWSCQPHCLWLDPDSSLALVISDQFACVCVCVCACVCVCVCVGGLDEGWRASWDPHNHTDRHLLTPLKYKACSCLLDGWTWFSLCLF